MISSSTKVVAARGALKAAASPAAAPAAAAAQPRQVGSDGAAQLHAGALAAQTGSAADAQDAGREFHPSHAKGHRPEILPKGQLQLRNATASGNRAEEIQEQAHDQRRNKHDGQTAQSEGQFGFIGQRDKALLVAKSDAQLKRYRGQPRPYAIGATVQQRPCLFGQAFQVTGNRICFQNTSNV
jgi:hypothetical protein